MSQLEILSMNYILKFTVFQGAGQFSQLSFDIEAEDDHTATVVANNELDNHHCLKGMTTLVRVDSAGCETLIANG